MLLVSGLVSVPKPLSQIQRSTLWLLQGLSPRTSFGGFGVNPREASELLQKVRDELQQIQDKDVRQASHDLYPAVIRLGLIPAVRSLRDRVDGMVRTELVVGKELAEIDGNNGRAFSEEFRIAVYRIVEEALSNVVKHSRATEATIELHYS